MGIDELKRWHWMVIGLLLGAIFGGSRVAFREPNMSGPRSYVRDQFEEVLWRNVDVRNLVLHPPINGQEWVTGELFRRDTANNGPRMQRVRKNATQPAQEWPGKWVSFPLLASDEKLSSAPPSAANKEYKTNVTAREYLASLQKDFPGGAQKLTYKFAWWEVPKAMLSIYTAAGFVLIGVIWPTIINLLTGAGFGRATKDVNDYDLSRFKSGGQKAATATKNDTSAQDQRLADLNAKLEADVAGMIMGSNISDVQREDEEEAQAIRQLETQRLEVEAKAQAEKQAQEYKGEFYPVAKPGAKKHDEH